MMLGCYLPFPHLNLSRRYVLFGNGECEFSISLLTFLLPSLNGPFASPINPEWHGAVVHGHWQEFFYQWKSCLRGHVQGLVHLLYSHVIVGLIK